MVAAVLSLSCYMDMSIMYICTSCVGGTCFPALRILEGHSCSSPLVVAHVEVCHVGAAERSDQNGLSVLSISWYIRKVRFCHDVILLPALQYDCASFRTKVELSNRGISGLEVVAANTAKSELRRNEYFSPGVYDNDTVWALLGTSVL